MNRLYLVRFCNVYLECPDCEEGTYICVKGDIETTVDTDSSEKAVEIARGRFEKRFKLDCDENNFHIKIEY